MKLSLPIPLALAIENVWLAGSNNPTPSALNGAKTTRPLLATVAPANLPLMLMVALMSTTVKFHVIGSNTPTLFALKGAKITFRAVAAAPEYFAPVVMMALMSIV